MLHGREMTRLDNTELMSLFDHLIGSCEQRRRHCEAERFGGLEVDNLLKLGWLLHRKFNWIRAA